MATPAETFLIFTLDLLALFALYLMLSTSLNLEYGYTGIPNFGKLLGVAAGAYVSGGITGRIAAWAVGVDPALDYVANNAQVSAQTSSALRANIPLSIGLFLFTLILAAVCGGVLGYLSSYPAIRLREDYLAMLLLGMAEAIRIIGYSYGPITGGPLGVAAADVFGWIPIVQLRSVNVRAYTFVMLGLAAIVLLYAERLVRSPLGRVLRAVRDNETAAATLGKDPVNIRTKILVISAGIAGLVGALNTFYTGAAIAPAYDRVNWTFIPWVMVILGGAANNFGAALGAFAFVTLRKLISFYRYDVAPFVPFDPIWLDTLLLGLFLILILMYRPQGLLPEKPTLTLSNDKLRRIISDLKSREAKPSAKEAEGAA